MAKIITLLLLLFGMTVSASSQQLLQLGPFGKPVMVLDEGENWSIPIQVYSDSDVAYYVPDITTPGWVYWHKDYFKLTGKYNVSVITWNKTNNLCLQHFSVNNGYDSTYQDNCKKLRYEQRLISIDTRNNTVTCLQEILMESDARLNPMNVTDSFPNPTNSFNKLSKRNLDAVNRINSIAIPELKGTK